MSGHDFLSSATRWRTYTLFDLQLQTSWDFPLNRRYTSVYDWIDFNVAKSLQSLKSLISCNATGSSTLHCLRNLPSTFTWDTGTKTRALTLSVAGLVELARPCSISGAANVETSSDRPQFLNAKVPVADSSKEVGLMILHILLWPEKKETFMYYRLYCSFTLKSHWGKQECTICLNGFIDFPLAQHDSMVMAL